MTDPFEQGRSNQKAEIASEKKRLEDEERLKKQAFSNLKSKLVSKLKPHGLNVWGDGPIYISLAKPEKYESSYSDLYVIAHLWPDGLKFQIIQPEDAWKPIQLQNVYQLSEDDTMERIGRYVEAVKSSREAAGNKGCAGVLLILFMIFSMIIMKIA